MAIDGDDYFNEEDDYFPQIGSISKRSAAAAGRRQADDEESVIRTTRKVRATSVAPASIQHYDDLDYEYDNSGLYRARRALSEARDTLRYIRASSESREASSYEEKSKESRKRSELEATKSSLLSSSGSSIYYKATITPKAESWSRTLPTRYWNSPSSALTDALLAEYSPRNFPDFEFGVSDALKRTHEPISSTWNYYTKPSYYDLLQRRQEDEQQTRRKLAAYSREVLDTDYDYYYGQDESSYDRSAAKQRQSSKYIRNEDDDYFNYFGDSGTAKYSRNEDDDYYNFGRTSSSKYYSGNEEDDYYNYSAANAKRESSMAALANFFDENSKLGQKARKLANINLDTAMGAGRRNIPAKFAHYWIPKYYEKTPMLGGWLQPESSAYRWRY